MKKRYIVVLIVMIVCILSTIKFTYGRFTYESEITGTVTTTSRNPFESGTLAYSIVDNAMNENTENQEKTIYSEEPLTKPAEQINGENERTLSVTQDDLGNSYYYRGNVQDNYIDFNNMCWRIVRIEGDGAIKLILEDKENTCKTAIGGENSFIGTGQYGYNITTLNGVENVKVADYENCTSNKSDCMKTKFDKWFNENNFDKRLLKEDTWNLGDLNTFYSWDNQQKVEFSNNSQLLFNTSLKVRELKLPMTLQKSENESTIKDYIATLSAEELAYLGAKWNTSNTNYYLYNKSHDWVLLSLHKIVGNEIHPFFVASEKVDSGSWWHTYNGMGSIIEMSYGLSLRLRPSIVLKEDIKLIDGNGTKEYAYKIDENPFESGTLAYEIVKNAQDVRDKKETDNTTKLSPVPETKPAQEISKEDERTLSLTEDTLGQSYYFRGNVEDNYFNFNNMCWRIVRIEGDGSIKLILEDKNTTCQNATSGDNAFIGLLTTGIGTYGYKTEDNIKKFDYKNCTDDSGSCMKNLLEEWFDEKFVDLKDNLKEDTWYIGDTTNLISDNYNYYQSGSRLMGEHNATLKETDNNFDSYISTLTADEVAFAGAMVTLESGHGNENCYLYLTDKTSAWWRTLTPLYQTSNETDGTYDTAFCVYPSTFVANCAVWNYSSIRPSIVLNNINVKSGNGLKTSPYVIE